jgi:hypothetical protein
MQMALQAAFAAKPVPHLKLAPARPLASRKRQIRQHLDPTIEPGRLVDRRHPEERLAQQFPATQHLFHQVHPDGLFQFVSELDPGQSGRCAGVYERSRVKARGVEGVALSARVGQAWRRADGKMVEAKEGYIRTTWPDALPAYRSSRSSNLRPAWNSLPASGCDAVASNGEPSPASNPLPSS